MLGHNNNGEHDLQFWCLFSHKHSKGYDFGNLQIIVLPFLCLVLHEMRKVVKNENRDLIISEMWTAHDEIGGTHLHLIES